MYNQSIQPAVSQFSQQKRNYAQSHPYEENPYPAGYGTVQVEQNLELARSSYVDATPQKAEPIQSEQKIVQRLVYPEPPPPAQPVEKKEKCISWCLYFLPLLFALCVVFILGNLLYVHTQGHHADESYDVVKYLESSLTTAPIQDVKLIDTQNRTPTHALRTHVAATTLYTCPEGYKEEPFGEWAGIDSGCLCDGEVKSSAYCLAHFSSNCKKVQKQSSTSISVWKSKKLCVKRAVNWKWVGNKQCEAGFKACSYRLCVQVDEPCPATKISPTYQVTTTQGEQPVIGFSLTPGTTTNAPCYDEKLSPQFESREYYPFSQKPEKGCGKYGMATDYVGNLDHDTVISVFNGNQLTPILNKEPNYFKYVSQQDTFTLQFVQRVRLGSSDVCDNVSSNSMFQIRSKSSTVHYYIIFLSVIGIILAAFIIVLMPIFFILRNRKIDLLQTKSFQHFKCFVLIAFILAVLCFILAGVYYAQVNSEGGLVDLHKKFDSFLKNDCFLNEGIQKAMKQVTDYSKETYKKNHHWITALFITSLLFLIVTIIALLLKHFTYKEKFFNDPWASN